MAEDRSQEQMNWADVLTVLLLPALGLAEGMAQAVRYLQTGLQRKSEAIDARRRFEREAHAAIERITGGEDG